MVKPFDPHHEIAADLDTPVSAFLKLKELDPVFLLESVTGGERLGRYSFIGLGTRNTISIDNGSICVDGVDDALTENPLVALRDWLRSASLPTTEMRRGPAGIVGYVGYEASGWFEDLPPASTDPLSLPQASFVVPEVVLAFDHVRSSLRVHPLVGSSRANELRKEIAHALKRGSPIIPPPARSGEPRPNHARRTFESSVERAREHIRSGDAYQIVLSTRFDGETEADAFAVYRALRLMNPSPYLYYLRTGETEIVGSSPEALARLEGRRAMLRPIAGTRPRGATDEDDASLAEELVLNAKENAEHTMLVDLARNDLGRVATPGTVQVSSYRDLERYSHVMHLVSTVEGVLRSGADQFDLFQAAFPAGTVTGAPKIRAMEIVSELEGEARGPYAGSVGYFGADGSMDQAIAIRTLVFNNGRYAYQAGAGIVADSVPEKEYAEVLNKGRALSRALELAAEPV